MAHCLSCHNATVSLFYWVINNIIYFKFTQGCSKLLFLIIPSWWNRMLISWIQLKQFCLINISWYNNKINLPGITLQLQWIQGGSPLQMQTHLQILRKLLGAGSICSQWLWSELEFLCCHYLLKQNRTVGNCQWV